MSDDVWAALADSFADDAYASVKGHVPRTIEKQHSDGAPDSRKRTPADVVEADVLSGNGECRCERKHEPADLADPSNYRVVDSTRQDAACEVHDPVDDRRREGEHRSQHAVSPCPQTRQLARLPLRRLDDVRHEQRDGHRTHTTGVRREVAGNLGNARVNIAEDL